MRTINSLALLVLISASLTAQNQPMPAFEVASIKVNSSGGGGGLGFSPGRFTGSNVTLRQMIRAAYGVMSSSQVVGGPDWIAIDRFNVEAKMPEGTAQAQGPMLLQTLLADRFKLKVHKDTRELPIYALTVTRSDGRLGAPIRPTQDDCVAILAARAKGESAPSGTNEKPVCSERLMARPIPTMTLTYRAGGKTMASFAEWIQQYVDRPVLDRTQLPGMFDLELQFALENPAAAAAAASQESPILFVALRQQLGLTLKAMNSPLDVVVIDSAEKPTPN
jgi:uncharacterized protein (TIGR03435 family)